MSSQPSDLRYKTNPHFQRIWSMFQYPTQDNTDWTRGQSNALACPTVRPLDVATAVVVAGVENFLHRIALNRTFKRRPFRGLTLVRIRLGKSLVPSLCGKKRRVVFLLQSGRRRFVALVRGLCLDGHGISGTLRPSECQLRTQMCFSAEATRVFEGVCLQPRSGLNRGRLSSKPKL